MLISTLIKSVCLSAFLLVVFTPTIATADIAIIIHPVNNNKLSLTKVRKIFLARSKTFPNGDIARPFELESSVIRKEFIRTVLNRTESSINAYWARMLFSSKAKPPKVIADVKAIKAMVANHHHAIAYIDTKDIDNTVKVALVVKTKPNKR